MCWLTKIVESQRWLGSFKGFPTCHGCLTRLGKPFKMVRFGASYSGNAALGYIRDVIYCSITDVAPLLDEDKDEDVINEKSENPDLIRLWNFLVYTA